MHAGVAAEEAVGHIRAGHPTRAAKALLQRSVAMSIAAVIEAAPVLRQLAGLG